MNLQDFVFDKKPLTDPEDQYICQRHGLELPSADLYPSEFQRMSNFVNNERYHGERYCLAGWTLQKWGDDLACFKTTPQRNIDQNENECNKANGKVPLPKDKYEEVSYRMIMIDMNPARLAAAVDLKIDGGKVVDSDGIDHTHRVNINHESHTYVEMYANGVFDSAPSSRSGVMFCQRTALVTEVTGNN